MAFTNYDKKEINCKILYHGARGAGKTENLRAVFKDTSKELHAGLLELEEGRGSDYYFEFLPVSIGQVGSFHLKLHLYTLPTIGLYETVPSIILKGIDGIVFVADSQMEAMHHNFDAIQELKTLLSTHGLNYAQVPKVFQYNKRDLPECVPVKILRQEINPVAAPDQEAVASQGKGTMETLQSMTKLVLAQLGA